MILEVVPSGPFQTNAYLFGCPVTRKGAIIDPSPGSASRLLALAVHHQLTLQAIYLTHSHWDHIADAAYFQLPVYVHPLDAPNLRTPGADRLTLVVPVTPVEPADVVIDGQQIQVGELKGIVLHTPGHSPGSVCYHFPEARVLFSGDTLFAGTIGNFSLPTAEPDKMWPSLDRLANLPADTRVYPGHGKSTTIGKEAWLPFARERFQ